MQRGSAIPLHRGAATFADHARGYAHPAASSTEGSLWIMLALVFGAVTFNMGLCFLNTGFITVSNLHVIGCEAIIITATLLYAYKEMNQAHLLLIGGIVLWTLLLSSLRVIFMTDDAFDIKIVRDLIIPIAFFLLGLRVKNLKHADFIVRVVVLVVLGFALFEYFALDVFIKYFSVAKYYIARGTMEAKQALQSADLFISGMRPAGAEGGRNLFPFLGDHRVSSVFLEPVSLGNFGVIVAIWAMVRSKFGDSYQIGLLLAAFVLIVLADSRFGAYLCILAFVLMLFPLGLATFGVVVLPLVALIVLIVVPLAVTGSYDPQNRYVDNGFVGRFVLAAQILGEFDVWTWLGLRAAQRQTFDSGYAYTISGIGVIGLTALWSVLFAAKGPDRQYYTLRNLMALYYGTILCVSNSPYTIKTASLTWFLIGAAAAVKPKRPMKKVVNEEQAVSSGAVPIPLHGRVRFKERAGSAA
jgi:putative polymerase